MIYRYVTLYNACIVMYNILLWCTCMYIHHICMKTHSQKHTTHSLYTLVHLRSLFCTNRLTLTYSVLSACLCQLACTTRKMNEIVTYHCCCLLSVVHYTAYQVWIVFEWVIRKMSDTLTLHQSQLSALTRHTTFLHLTTHPIYSQAAYTACKWVGWFNSQ
jgi:hypothetical protein